MCFSMLLLAAAVFAALSDELAMRLRSIDPSLLRFAPQFSEAGISDISDFALLEDGDLVAIGLNLVQRRRLQKYVQQASVKTFGSAGKAVSLVKGENHLYNHTCPASPGAECVLRHMWFGGSWAHYDIQRLRVYVDGEPKPSIDGQLFLLHGIGFADADAPWSSGALFGKTGNPSGIFNTFQIPFSSSIRITMQAYDGQKVPSNTTERFWWIFRGTEGEEGVTLGTRMLPPGARLKLYTNEAISQPARSQLQLFETAKSGAVLMNVLSVNAVAEQFLEGEVRADINGVAKDSCSYGICSSLTMSSGTGSQCNPQSIANKRNLLIRFLQPEDYFLGTYYFNKGTYHNLLSGCSHLQHATAEAKTTKTESTTVEKASTSTSTSTITSTSTSTSAASGEWQFSGYRRHDHDSLTFPSGGFNMSWRCGEPGAGSTTDCTTFTYSLVYEW